MSCELCVKHLPGETECVWHREHKQTGKEYSAINILPSKVCPIMYHTLYPYFLGALFGAKYAYNDEGDCQVCCPAEKGVDVLVRVRPNDGKFEAGVDADWRDVIHAEVMAVHGHCDYGHKVGDRIVFPTTRSMRTQYMCPAGFNNIFPFLKIETPSCINPRRLRCPDWEENIYYAIPDGHRRDEDDA